jgi:Fic family protein
MAIMNTAEKLVTLDTLKSDIDKFRPINADQERMVMQKFRLDWNFHSNAIEGNSLSIGETAALLSYGLTAKGKPLKDHLDISGHDAALDTLIAMTKNLEPLTEHSIRGLHEVMLGGSHEVKVADSEGRSVVRRVEAGRYKSSPNHVTTESGVTRYFSSPTDTPIEMEELVKWCNAQFDSTDFHPVIFAATFHHRFVKIHPFDDGNGRMARILMNLILMRAGYLPAIFKIEQRGAYIASLVQADAGELGPLIELLTDSSIHSANIYLKALKGEPIDDLADFDKQLKLLSQSILSEEAKAGQARSNDVVFDICINFLIPIFSRVEASIDNIENLFGGKIRHLFVIYSDGNAHDFGITKNALSSLRGITGDKCINRISFFFNGTSFVKNSTKNLLISLDCDFGPHSYSIVVSMTAKSPKELLRAGYDVRCTSVDVENMAKEVLHDTVDVLKSIANSN